MYRFMSGETALKQNGGGDGPKNGVRKNFYTSLLIIKFLITLKALLLGYTSELVDSLKNLDDSVRLTIKRGDERSSK